MAKWKRRLLWGALSILCIVLIGAIGWMVYGHSMASSAYDAMAKKISQDLDKYTEPFIADQKRLSSHPWAVDGPCVRDAGPFLNPGIPWQGDAENEAGREKKALAEWETIHRLWKDLEGEKGEENAEWWTAPAASFDTSAIDFGWMSRLSSYDCWDIDSSGPRKGLTPSSIGEFMAMPNPNYSRLWNAARVRIIQGVQRGEARDALREAHDLGRLMLTTESSISHTIGKLLLINLSKAVRAMESSGMDLSDVPRWEAEDEAALERFNLYTWPAYSQLMTPVRYRKVIEMDFSPAPGTQSFGRCAGLNEALGTLTYMRGLLEEEAFVWLDGVLERSPCRLTQTRKIWENPDFRVENDYRAFCQVGEEEGCGYPAPKWLPEMVQETLGMILVSVATPSPFSGYMKQ